MTEEPAPRPAATVVLLRPSGDRPTGHGSGVAGFEVFVLRRVASMAFAPSMTVFPGGGVDPADAEPVPWRGPDPAWFAHRFGQSGPGVAERARRVVVAAVRELWEETGLLLAVPSADATGAASARTGPGPSPSPSSPSPSSSPSPPSSSLSVSSSLSLLSSSFGARLARDHLAIDATRLRPWAHWVTPPGRPRRYDTLFFVAALPDGAAPRLSTTEADEGAWATPEALLAADGAGSVRLMPPTRAVLTDLARHATVAEILAAEPDIVPWTRNADGGLVRYVPHADAPSAR